MAADGWKMRGRGSPLLNFPLSPADLHQPETPPAHEQQLIPERDEGFAVDPRHGAAPEPSGSAGGSPTWTVQGDQGPSSQL